MSHQIDKFLWFKSDKSDKIWGYFTTGYTIYNFWGKRGSTAKRAIKFKRHTADTAHITALERLYREKLRKGYVEINQEDIEQTYPDFFIYLEESIMFEKLRGAIKNDY